MTAQRPAIVITRRLAPGIVEVLAGCCEVRQHDSERPMSRTLNDLGLARAQSPAGGRAQARPPAEQLTAGSRRPG